MSKPHRCPTCGARQSKVIYWGLPGRFCTACTTLMGPASYAAGIHFSGVLFFYYKSYPRAVVAWAWWELRETWKWLTNQEGER